MLHLRLPLSRLATLGLVYVAFIVDHSFASSAPPAILPRADTVSRERLRLRDGWKFQRTAKAPDGVTYDERPDNKGQGLELLKPWILPVANDFLPNVSAHYSRPSSEPKTSMAYVSSSFDDASWKSVVVPHDWAIGEDFLSRDISADDMARLPVQGVGWYRRQVDLPAADKGKTIYLEIDGAMSYTMVWLNGKLLGGWPYGYNSFRIDLTPYANFGGSNTLAIRVENPQSTSFSRWYPGAGIYRNVWLLKIPNNIQIAQYGTTFVTSNATTASATVDMTARIRSKNASGASNVTVRTDVHKYDSPSGSIGRLAARFPARTVTVKAGETVQINATTRVCRPALWGPPPGQTPNLYIATTSVYEGDTLLDSYTTTFGIRTLEFDGTKGLLVNGQQVYINGVNQHHDLGALGAAFNLRAATRQLEMLRELGVNTIRMSHNPPAPELLKLTDEWGFLVIDEIFDYWEDGKRDTDFSLNWDDWHEADLRAFLRRDRNHPSIFLWSHGNEVYEQASDQTRAARIATELTNIVTDEDPTRPSTASIFRGKAGDPFPNVLQAININYLGEGSRYGPAYANLTGYRTEPLYKSYHETYPDKLILGSEVSASFSTRGTFVFPVTGYESSPVDATHGLNSSAGHISAYELYTVDSGSSPDRVFRTQDENPYVAGGIVWSGFDYLGETAPFRETGRSSNFGIIDLAGFKKERFYLYQSRWRSDLRMAKIIPHWNFPERAGLVTPVHVFTSADEAELFINGKSLGRKKRGTGEYRFRWDDVVWESGTVKVTTYKNGAFWAEDSVQTTGPAAGLTLTPDRASIISDGDDLSFVTALVKDSAGLTVPNAANNITFSVSGPGKVVATDNGFPGDLTSFPSLSRKAFSGMALAIISGNGTPGTITLTAEADGLTLGTTTITTT